MKHLFAMGVALLTLAVVGSPARADTSLIGQWHLDDGAGSTVADTSGNANDGLVSGGAQWVAGRFGTALSFDGGTSRVRVSDNAALAPTSAVSVTAWVKNLGSPGAFRYVVAKGATGCIAASYGLYTGPDGGLAFYVSKNRGTTYTRSPDPGLGVWNGQWHMIVGTFDGGAVRLFVDGAEIGDGTARAGALEYLLPDSNDLFIGDYPGCQAHNFAGTIDEINIWGRALSPADIEGTFSQPSQAPAGSGGSTTPSAPQTGPAGGSGGSPSPTHQGTPPTLRGLTMAPSSFAVMRVRARRSRTRPIIGTTISYIDTQAARSSFSVLLRRPGIKVGQKCVTSARGNGATRRSACPIYVPSGTFSHADHVGRNSFHFSGIGGLRLRPGKYLLEVVPSAHGQLGRAVRTNFTIIP